MMPVADMVKIMSLSMFEVKLSCGLEVVSFTIP